MEKRIKYILACLISFVLLLAFWFWCYHSTNKIAQNIEASNIYSYFIGICLFFLFILTSIRIIAAYDKKNNFERPQQMLSIKKQIVTCFGITTFFCCVFLQWIFISEWDEQGCENGAYYFYPLIIRVIITIGLLSVIAIYVVKKMDINKENLYLGYFLSVIICFMGNLIFNPFSDWGGDMVNISSITESIYNVYDMIPFDWNTTPIYGHYALFFLIPLKIFGANVISVAMCVSITALLEQLFMIYIVDSFNVKKWIKLLIIFAAIERPTYRYLAITPFRTLWPLLTCAWIIYIHKKEKTKWIYINSFLIVGMAILWNAETGFGCFAAMLSYYLWTYIYEIKYNHKLQIKKSVCVFLLGVCSICLPIIIVNIYNKVCGANFWVLKSFFYPFVGNDWAINALKHNVPFGNHAWIYIIALLLFCVAWSVIKILYLDADKRYILLNSIAILGVVLFLYYFNEAHWGCMNIVRKICAILTLFIIEDFYVTLEKRCDDVISQIKRIIVFLALFSWGILSVSVVMSDPIRISEMYRTGTYDIKIVRDEIYSKFKNFVPDNVYGVGQGINVIYHELGWDNHSNYKDTSALHDIDYYGAYNELVNEIRQKDEFIIGGTMSYDKALLNSILQEDNFVLNGEYEVCGYKYYYYSR